MPGNSVNERYKNWLDTSKTVFPFKKRVSTTFNLGQLVPLGFIETLPGDTHTFDNSSFLRLLSPTVKAPMETLKLHQCVFAVPIRILIDDFKKIMGERDDYDTKPSSEYKIPLVNFPQGVWNYSKSILSYFGAAVPSADDKAQNRIMSITTKVLSNAYAEIWNTHFRDQNLQPSKVIDKGPNDIDFIAETDPNSDWFKSQPNQYTGKLASVNRNFDYFSNVFTDTQKGDPIVMPLGNQAKVLPVNGVTHSPTDMAALKSTYSLPSGDTYTPTQGDQVPLSFEGSGSTADYTALKALNVAVPISGTNLGAVNPNNLFADLASASTLTLNDFRAIQKLQKRQELDLVAGTRYFEIVDSYFGVKNVLDKLDYSQWISYSSSNINISQVVQTSGDIPNSTPQGNIAGYAAEFNQRNGITNFTSVEHSVLIPMVYITQNHRYQHGNHKFFSRRSRLDFFDPEQIGLGFQPIYKNEIYSHLTDSEKDDIWAYAPNAERYRKSTDIITGSLAANAEQSLGTWTAGDVYIAPPVYSSDWKIEKPIYLDNCLQFGSNISDQFILETNFDGIKVSTVDALGTPSI